MHRIDTPGNQAGLFVPPNPLTGQQPVKVDSAWLNDLQENIMAVLVAGGIAPVKGDANNLRDAIIAIITGDFPAFVSSFNTRTGNVVLEGEDVDNALGYTPANRAGDNFTGLVGAAAGFEATTVLGPNFGVRIAADATNAACIIQFTNHDGTSQWATLTVSAAGQPVEMNGHALATLDSPDFTGDPTVPTAAPGTDTTQAASCAFVHEELAALPSAAKGGSAAIAFPAAGSASGTVGSQGWRKDASGLITQWAYIQLEDTAAASPATWDFPIPFAVAPLGFHVLNCAIAAGQAAGNSRNATCNMASLPTATSAEFTLFQTNSTGTLAIFYVEVNGF